MTKSETDEVEYTKPTSQLDLEARQENGNASFKVLSTSDQAPKPGDEDEDARSYVVEDNDLDGYLNVDPIYMNYASDTEQPLLAEEGPEQVLEEFIREESPTASVESATVTGDPNTVGTQSTSEEDSDESTSDESTSDESSSSSSTQTTPGKRTFS